MADPRRGGYDPADEERAKAEAEKRNASRSTFSKLFGVGKVLPEDILREKFQRTEVRMDPLQDPGLDFDKFEQDKKQRLQEKKVVGEKGEVQHQTAEKQKSLQEATKKISEEQERIANVFKDAEKYIERIKAADASVIRDLESLTGVDRPYMSRGLEGIIGALLRVEHLESDSKASELMETLAEKWTTSSPQEMGGWTHSVCHLFEGYQKFSREEKQTGLLTDKRWKHAAEILIVELLSRASDVKRFPLDDTGHRHNLSRVFVPLAQYNLDEVDLNHLDTFVLKPEYPDYLVVAEQKSGKDMNAYGAELRIEAKEFLRASSPKDFILRLIRDGVRLPTREDAKAIQLLDAVKVDVPQDEMDTYLKKAYPVNDVLTDLETIEKNIAAAKEAKEQVVGLFVDVDGTLIQQDRINMDVLKEMEMAVKHGTAVVVFTGGEPEMAAEKLKALGLSGEFLKVKRKSDFAGKVLERLIDDTDPLLQGFKATKWEKVFRR